MQDISGKSLDWIQSAGPIAIPGPPYPEVDVILESSDHAQHAKGRTNTGIPIAFRTFSAQSAHNSLFLTTLVIK
jgi:hypothetical protein